MDSVTLPLAFAAGVVTFASPCFLPIVPVFIAYLAGSTPASLDRGEPAHANAEEGVARSGARGQRDPEAATTAIAKPTIAAVPAIPDLLVVERGSVGVAPPEQWRPVRVGGAPRSAGAAISESSERATARSSRGRALVNALAFVAAFTVIFVSLWAAIASIGWVVGDLREALRVAGGVVLIVLGLFALGLLRIPSLERTRRLGGALPASGEPTVSRSVLLGFAFGAGWSPCIGPVLGMILGMALTSGTALSGLGLLLVFCLGLGLPFVLIALGASGLKRHLSVLSRHFKTFQVVSGILMIAMGFLMIADLLAPLSGISWVKI
ncbi:cytochrome c biogenesis protein CcdA [Actinomycetaceae bacterium L2_0104]